MTSVASTIAAMAIAPIGKVARDGRGNSALRPTVHPRRDGTSPSTATDGPKYGLATGTRHPYALARSGTNSTHEHPLEPNPSN